VSGFCVQTLLRLLRSAALFDRPRNGPSSSAFGSEPDVVSGSSRQQVLTRTRHHNRASSAAQQSPVREIGHDLLKRKLEAGGCGLQRADGITVCNYTHSRVSVQERRWKNRCHFAAN
jgi:hypothetical protein